MSLDQYRKGLQDLLDRLREQGHLAAIPKSAYQVKQLLELAHTNVERTRHLVRDQPADYDWQVATLWDAVIEASKATLASMGYRLKGAEGMHGDLTQAAAYILAPDHREAATSLKEISSTWLNLRNQVKYERRGVVGKGTRDDILGKAGPILQALSAVSSTAVGEAPDFDDWSVTVA
jgi:hypothetical protein